MTSISLSALRTRLSRASRELVLFAAASLVMGMAFSMFDSSLNNFLNERFALTGFQRSFLEFPRELPGFLVVFVSAALSFLGSRRLGFVALLLGMAGALLIGFASPSYWVMVIWLFIYSTGQHLFMPVASTIGMELAREGKTGQRLGQLNAIRNVAMIMGSFLIFLGFRYLGFTFQTVFVLTALALLVAAGLMLAMKPDKVVQRPSTFMKLHKEYRLYYVLATLSGSRKQLFITFAPWVLVSVFNQPVQIMATLMTIGGVIGIVFQPLLGWTIDRLGERFVLMTEAVLLVVVCMGYGFSRSLFSEQTAFYIACGCYLFDQMLISVSMARSTYIKKIAKRPEDVQPALTVSVTIDHIFSISAALVGGVIWSTLGYQYVFLMGAGIALLNLLTARHIRIPLKEAAGEPVA